MRGGGGLGMESGLRRNYCGVCGCENVLRGGELGCGRSPLCYECRSRACKM